MKKNKLQKRIESLVFHGTNDEAYELFEATCHFCYLLYGCNEKLKAGLLYEWAKEMADYSVGWGFDPQVDVAHCARG